MEIKDIIAQGIGILAMVFNILSYQGKKQKTVIALQLIGGALFAGNFWMIGAKIGGILNVIAVIRAVLFLFKDKVKADSIFWLIGFILSYIAVYVLTFTVFGTELTPWHLVRELLPVVGMTALSVGFRLKDAAGIRKCGLISSPAWLMYNIAVGFWGAIVCESLTLISIVVGMFRHDKKS